MPPSALGQPGSSARSGNIRKRFLLRKVAIASMAFGSPLPTVSHSGLRVLLSYASV